MMLSFRVFLATSGLWFLLLLVLQSAPDGDPFAADGGILLGNLDGLPAGDIAALKLGHADAVPRYDVGLFGNSRIIQVGADDMGMDGGRVFNFAVPGSSIRQSVALLESLDRIGKLPRTVILSFDNAALEYYGNPVYPGPPERWLSALRDVTRGARNPGIGLDAVARMAWRHGFTEWRSFVGLLSAGYLRSRLFANLDRDAESVYRSDGSRPRRGSAEFRRLPPLDALAPSIMPGYLAYDLSRLAAIRTGEVRLLVYESPLAPGLSHASSANANAVRQRFLAACAAQRIACAIAPDLGGDGDPPYWDDVSHAPGSLLGAWLAGQIAAAGPANTE